MDGSVGGGRVGISPDELPALLGVIRDKAAKAAPDTVMGMAEAYRRGVQVTLRRYSHPFATKTDSPPGQPPAYVLGALSRSVTAVPGSSSGMNATAFVSPHTVYARLQELGGHIRPVRARFLRWEEDGAVHYSKHVYIPPRPYMRPTTERMVADGSLTRAGMREFAVKVWG